MTVTSLKTPDFADDLDYDEQFCVDVVGFEGPLHLLLELARRQKVDLLHVSVLELATQYLTFIEDAKHQRIDLAADYLLMAAWLAYLKSRLLLPKTTHSDGDDIAPEEDARQLAFRLRRLEAMRDAAQALLDRNLVGRDVFLRGSPQQPKVMRTTEYDTSLWHLTQAFGAIRTRKAKEAPHAVESQYVLPLENARESLRAITLDQADWASLEDIRAQLAPQQDDVPDRSVLASVFSATLELTRDGEIDVRQDRHFAPLYVRGKAA